MHGRVTVAAGSAVAANMERGSVPSSTLLSGSTTELEDEDDVEEVLPFRLTFFVFDSVTCGENPRGQVEFSKDFPEKHSHAFLLIRFTEGTTAFSRDTYFL